jgi:hypothetical protein
MWALLLFFLSFVGGSAQDWFSKFAAVPDAAKAQENMEIVRASLKLSFPLGLALLDLPMIFRRRSGSAISLLHLA